MASCVSSCDTGDLDLCANKCFEVYWPIVKGPGNLESRSLLLERGTIPVRNAGRHETDEMNGDAGQDSQHAGNEHGDSPTGPQNELPIKVYTTVTSHTTLYTEPTQAPAPRPSETPAHEGGNKGDTSMASFTTKNGLTTAMITTLAVASAWLLTA
ncbi:hypothetical protein BC941DRAFT_466137 [Chlamydoabsidia padenii]|nr:hypothetical protein BC941DRAFT_466137 [Chlamydoabsidia padenii]